MTCGHTDIEQLIFDNANVTVTHVECTSDAGEQSVTQQLASVACEPWVFVTVFIEAEDRDVPQFVPELRIHREVDGVPVTLRGFLNSVEDARYERRCTVGNFKVCYRMEVE